MLNRRHLLATGLAALGMPACRATAHEANDNSQVVPPAFQPKIVSFQAGLPAGEIHVDPDRLALYWTLPDQMAIRFSCGIGRPGLYESGEFYVGDKRKWPSWTPTSALVEREPERYERYAEHGMPGGPDNPLEAWALYLFTPERGDTLLRIHGTNAPQTIGTAVSNGCARLLNDHIVELYEAVPLETRVVLYPQSGSSAE